jgi:uncharacterized protein YqiB (DUF1249 family)
LEFGEWFEVNREPELMEFTSVCVANMLDLRTLMPEIDAPTCSFCAVTISFTGSISAATMASTISGILYPEPLLLIMLT